MTAYLQRLLGRAAGVAASPTAGEAGARPMLQSQSPVVAFDQRLADPALAEDFAIVGATPDAPDSPEAEPVAGDPLPDAAGPAPARKRGARRAARIDEPAEVLPRDATTADAAAALPARPAEPARTSASDAAPTRRVRPAPDAVAALDARPALSRPAGHFTRDDAPPAPPVVRADAPMPAALDSEPVASAVSKIVRQRAADIADQPAIAPRAPSPPAALDAVTPAALESRASPAQPAPAQPVPALLPLDRQASVTAEPVSAPAAPLPPLAHAAAGLTRAEIERIVRETLAAERPAPPAESRRESEPEPVRRPASAAEASVIGKLESSGFRPMLFGVRRR